MSTISILYITIKLSQKLVWLVHTGLYDTVWQRVVFNVRPYFRVVLYKLRSKYLPNYKYNIKYIS